MEAIMGLHSHGAVGNEGRILIVDDEAQVRKPIGLTLQAANYNVVEAENGEEAIELLKSGDNPLLVDTILCDIRMPKINGTEAIHYFRTHFPTVPIVVLTGYPDTELAVSLLKQGVEDYLVKPVTKEKLLEVMKKSVARHILMKDQFTT
jgi:two-component system, chemotaxis family, chemotaxis protein CheY